MTSFLSTVRAHGGDQLLESSCSNANSCTWGQSGPRLEASANDAEICEALSGNLRLKGCVVNVPLVHWVHARELSRALCGEALQRCPDS